MQTACVCVCVRACVLLRPAQLLLHFCIEARCAVCPSVYASLPNPILLHRSRFSMRARLLVAECVSTFSSPQPCSRSVHMWASRHRRPTPSNCTDHPLPPVCLRGLAMPCMYVCMRQCMHAVRYYAGSPSMHACCVRYYAGSLRFDCVSVGVPRCFQSSMNPYLEWMQAAGGRPGLCTAQTVGHQQQAASPSATHQCDCVQHAAPKHAEELSTTFAARSVTQMGLPQIGRRLKGWCQGGRFEWAGRERKRGTGEVRRKVVVVVVVGLP